MQSQHSKKPLKNYLTRPGGVEFFKKNAHLLRVNSAFFGGAQSKFNDTRASKVIFRGYLIAQTDRITLRVEA